MKRLLSTLLVASMLANPTFAAAEEDRERPPTIAPVNKDQPAPFAGILFTPEAVAKVIAQQDAQAQALKLAVQHQADVDAAQARYQLDSQATTYAADKDVLQAQLDASKQQYALVNEQLKRTTTSTPASVWIGVGAVGGVVLTVITVFAVSKASK